ILGFWLRLINFVNAISSPTMEDRINIIFSFFSFIFFSLFTGHLRKKMKSLVFIIRNRISDLLKSLSSLLCVAIKSSLFVFFYFICFSTFQYFINCIKSFIYFFGILGRIRV